MLAQPLSLFSPRQEELLDFVKEAHGFQLRRYTAEPYWTHPVSVATMVVSHGGLLVEIALCHDLLEDTQVTRDQLNVAIIASGYTYDQAGEICAEVIHLTDQYTKTAYPTLNREKRKKRELERMAGISPAAQTVKYADIMDNAESIYQHDRGFRGIYISECLELLSVMTTGDAGLRERAVNMLRMKKKFMNDK